MKNGFIKLLGVFFICLFAVGAVATTREAMRGNASKDWPSVPGKILSSKVVEGKPSKPGQSPMFGAKISYEYLVAGARYTSTRVSFADYNSSGGGHARELVKAYPVGKEVTVYHSPDQPEMSVLEPGSAWWMWLIATILSMIAFISPITWLFGKKPVPSNPATGSP
jgi:hypothetical protein